MFQKSVLDVWVLVDTPYSPLASGRLSRLIGTTSRRFEECYVPHELVGVMAQNGKQKGGNVV